MLLSFKCRLGLLVWLLFAVQFTAALDARILRRQDEGSTSATADTESGAEPTTSSDVDPEQTVSSTLFEEEEPEPTTRATATSTNDERSATSTTAIAISTNGALDDSNFLNVTIPDGQLPLTPALTPGWGVAGAVMLVTGGIHTLVGIKNRWIHTFFSTAYAGALGIAVLIVYVMNVPVSDALQGGYVAAVVLSGCAFGAASVFFKELTEGLGCALGGFCISMWLLCLTPGGLLKPVASKAIFISCFTLVAFAFYFSRYTRDWALISMISFAGGTIIVLGIDCFTRAGLKEFWAYIWDINENLFPLGADTYPITKGIRVETAAIIIIFLVGIISQIKLWRIVRDKREQRAAERAEGQRNLAQEEADVGRKVEETTARERREWERAYGDQDIGRSSLSDHDSEKRLRQSYNSSAKPQTEGDVYELSDVSDSNKEHRKIDPMETDQEGRVIVRVAVDDDAPAERVESADDIDERHDAPISAHGHDKALTEKRRQSSITSGTETPQLVPLPFTVPTTQHDDVQSTGERSSIATFADDDNAEADIHRRSYGFAKRLSRGSSKILRSLSQRSAGTRHPASPDVGGESSEDLVIPRTREDDESSIAATLDGQSMAASNRHSMLSVGEIRDLDLEMEDSKEEARIEEVVAPAGINSVDQTDSDYKPRNSSLQQDAGSEHITNSRRASKSQADGAEASQSGQAVKPKSVISVNSTPASLTKERLPDSLSKVALSYRTNEWAKHLSYADAPEPEQLNIKVPDSARRKSVEERAAPVKVEELQQGIGEGIPAPSIVQSASRQSKDLANVAVLKRQSRQTDVGPSSPDKDQAFSLQSVSANHTLLRASSSSALRRTSSTFEPIAEEHDAVNSTTPHPAVEDDNLRQMTTSPALSMAASVAIRASASGIVPYSSPQTLLGQRDMYLRSRSSGNLLANLPEEMGHGSQYAPSDVGSLYNYPTYASLAVDPDDMPLSQRKEMMRHNSLSTLQGVHPLQRASSGMDLAETSSFNSHQPKRNSTLPTLAAREAQLASFRSSVAMDLRSGNPMMTSQSRETPFASTTNLLKSGRESEIKRNIDLQRDRMLGQKEAEAQQREMNRQQREFTDRVFDERMRSGELLDAHREAMRKMQKGARGH